MGTYKIPISATRGWGSLLDTGPAGGMGYLGSKVSYRVLLVDPGVISMVVLIFRGPR